MENLQTLQEQQQQWTIPDALLQSNMKDAIAEDFLPSYHVSAAASSALPVAHNGSMALHTRHAANHVTDNVPLANVHVQVSDGHVHDNANA